MLFPMLIGVPLENAVTTDIILPLLFAMFAISCSLAGKNKLAGWLSIITAASMIGVILKTSHDSGVSLAIMFTYMPSAWYLAISALIVLIVGIVMLTNKSVRYYATRRRELEKGLPSPLKDLGNN